VADDSKNDTVAASQVVEAAHGPDASAHLAESPLDHVGRAHFLPMAFGNRKEVQQAVQIAFDAGHRFGPPLLPGEFPIHSLFLSRTPKFTQENLRYRVSGWGQSGVVQLRRLFIGADFDG